MMSVKSLLLFLFAALFLAGCGGASSSPPSFFEVTASLPGERIALSSSLPPGFAAGSGADVFRAHAERLPLWVFSAKKEDMEEGLAPWLKATNSLHFYTDMGEVWRVPVADEDLLALVEVNHLQPWVDTVQWARLLSAQGDKLRAGNDFERAEDVYEQAIAADPDFADAYVGLGAALLGQGKNDRALAVLLQAVALNPDNYWGQKLLGNIYIKFQRYDLAVAPLSRTYMLRPEEPQLLIAVALALGRSGKQRQALQVLDLAASQISDARLLGDIQTLRAEFSAGAD